jgi:hypothetical protein
MMAELHDRMPAVIEQADWPLRLGEVEGEPQSLLHPPAENLLRDWPDDVAIRAHSDPLPDSTLVQRTLSSVPWFLFAGSGYLDATDAPQTPQDLAKHPSLFMMRTGVAPAWRLRHSSAAKEGVVIPLRPFERRHDQPEAGGDCGRGDRRAAGLRVS